MGLNFIKLYFLFKKPKQECRPFVVLVFLVPVHLHSSLRPIFLAAVLERGGSKKDLAELHRVPILHQEPFNVLFTYNWPKMDFFSSKIKFFVIFFFEKIQIFKKISEKIKFFLENRIFSANGKFFRKSKFFRISKFFRKSIFLRKSNFLRKPKFLRKSKFFRKSNFLRK